MSKMLFSLDIGSSKIIALVGSIGETIEVHGVSNYYYTTSNKSNDYLNVNNGVVCNIETVSVKVLQVLNEAKINADCSSGGVIVNIAGSNVRSIYSKNRIDLNNTVITFDVMQQLITDARKMELPANYESLDYEVQEYILDGQNYSINPLHLTANSIESNINIFTAGRSAISNLKKIVRYSGFNLAKIVPSGVLSGMSVLHYEEKELGCCLIDIGAGTTDIVVYENGFIRYIYSIPIGGEDITRDISAVLKISRNLAEDIKINYGSCAYVDANYKLRENISVTDHRGLNIIISRKLLIDIINERLKEIFQLVKTEIHKQKIYDIISSGMVITGGTALLPSIEENARQYFNMPVRIGVPLYNGNFSDLITSPKYATSLGTLYFAKEYMAEEIKAQNSPNYIGNIKKIMNRLFTKSQK